MSCPEHRAVASPEQKGITRVERLSHFVLAHKRLVALSWLVIFIAGMIATPHVTNRLSTEFSLPGQK